MKVLMQSSDESSDESSHSQRAARSFVRGLENRLYSNRNSKHYLECFFQPCVFRFASFISVLQNIYIFSWPAKPKYNCKLNHQNKANHRQSLLASDS